MASPARIARHPSSRRSRLPRRLRRGGAWPFFINGAGAEIGVHGHLLAPAWHPGQSARTPPQCVPRPWSPPKLMTTREWQTRSGRRQSSRRSGNAKSFITAPAAPGPVWPSSRTPGSGDVSDRRIKVVNSKTAGKAAKSRGTQHVSRDHHHHQGDSDVDGENTSSSQEGRGKTIMAGWPPPARGRHALQQRCVAAKPSLQRLELGL